MNTFAKPFLNLVEGQGINRETEEHFPKGEWMTSLYFQDQTYEQFYRTLTTFLLSIQKNLPIFNSPSQVSLSNLFNDQYTQQEFKLKNIAVQIQSAACRLQLCIRIYLLPSNIVYFYGKKDHQQVKILIKQQSEPKLSFIFGLQANVLNLKKPEFKQDIQQQSPVFLNTQQNLGQQRYLQNQKLQMQISNHQPIHAQQVFLQNPSSQLQVINRSKPFQNNQETETIQVLTTFQIAEGQTTSEAQAIPRLNLSVPQFELNIEMLCNVCNEQYQKIPEQQILLPCCRKIIHKNCILEELQITTKQLSNMNCKFCHQIFDINFLKYNIPSDIFQQKIKEQVLLLNQTDEQMLLIYSCDECFSCYNEIQILPEQRKQPLPLECQNCKAIICTKCKQGSHESDQLCQENTKKTLKSKQRQSITINTNCTIIQTKEDGSDHMICDQCKMDLRSVSKMDRRSIISDENHSHQKGCTCNSALIRQERITQESVQSSKPFKQNTYNQCPIPKRS